MSHSNAFPIEAPLALQDDCICHVFDGNLGELLVLSCKHMVNSGDNKYDFQNNPGAYGLYAQSCITITTINQGRTLNSHSIFKPEKSTRKVKTDNCRRQPKNPEGDLGKYVT
jgi:hypothetical protein